MAKKIINRAIKVLTLLIFLFAIFVFVTVIVAKIRNQPPRILGYSFHIVVTDSMEPEINVGDFVIVKHVDKSKIEIGDDIVFISLDPKLNGITIIHRVVDIKDGAFETRGVNPKITESDRGPDGKVGYVTDVIGRYQAKSAFLGKIFTFFSNPVNMIFAVIVLLLLYITVRLVKKTIKIVSTSQDDTESNSDDQITKK